MNWFWVITLQQVTGYGQRVSTVTGEFTADQVAALGTRPAAFSSVKASARAAMGMEDGSTVVLFYSLEPSSLERTS